MNIMNWDTISNRLPLKLREPLPGILAHKRMLPAFRSNEALIPSADARESGVLILLYPDSNHHTQIVLIQRSNDGGTHSGQIALPGGKREPNDVDIIHTALREAEEEVSLKFASIDVIGQLSPLYINVSNFVVQPVIALSSKKPELIKSDYEVSRILYADLGKMFASKTEEKIVIPSTGSKMYWKAPVYKLEDNSIVWGATAMILSELELIYDTLK